MKQFFKLKLKLIAILLILPTYGMADYSAGIDYQEIKPAQSTNSGTRIEVVELFWYGCPHCYRLEPYIQRWKKTKPEDVKFEYMPAALNPSWELAAKAYYVAVEHGVAEKMHTAIFAEIHKKRKRLREVNQFIQLFAQHGISKEKFMKSFNESFYVFNQTRRSKIMPARYGATSVPNLVVHGKYLISASMAGGNDNLIKVLNYLIEKERKVIQAKKKTKGLPEKTEKTPPSK